MTQSQICIGQNTPYQASTEGATLPAHLPGNLVTLMNDLQTFQRKKAGLAKNTSTTSLPASPKPYSAEAAEGIYMHRMGGATIYFARKDIGGAM